MKPTAPQIPYRVLLPIAVGFICFVISALELSHATQLDIKHSGLSKQQAKTVNLWITQGIDAVEQTLSPIPMDSLTIEVVRKRYAREPVPFAQVDRGSPTKVKLQVDANASLQEFVDDWTLYHELSHLYLPYLDTPHFG
ncbi:hypothetical protein FM037_02460 [Shewanella psychropiezotolerans]|uniref:Peptidase M61 catalytic domain-containing protein n=1 Tax=Shewanella psychropiezotolerans TaxID=2593655 RepID=A0ABX5WT86_9GAMM|nr:hypothetical protein [Shewanella psychropiezotolerans]QDO82310.1 hypothetical protein FM037_02460 [Shewanella psychropiezotolerans]